MTNNEIMAAANAYAANFKPSEQRLARKAWIDGFNTAMAAERPKTAKKRVELDLSFIHHDFRACMDRWVTYKKERKQSYTQIGIETCYKKLLGMSANNPVTMQLIIDQSISNNWAGLFPLKNNNYSNGNQQANRKAYTLGQLAYASDAILQGFASSAEYK